MKEVPIFHKAMTEMWGNFAKIKALNVDVSSLRRQMRQWECQRNLELKDILEIVHHAHFIDE